MSANPKAAAGLPLAPITNRIAPPRARPLQVDLLPPKGQEVSSRRSGRLSNSSTAEGKGSVDSFLHPRLLKVPLDASRAEWTRALDDLTITRAPRVLTGDDAVRIDIACDLGMMGHVLEEKGLLAEGTGDDFTDDWRHLIPRWVLRILVHVCPGASLFPHSPTWAELVAKTEFSSALTGPFADLVRRALPRFSCDHVKGARLPLWNWLCKKICDIFGDWDGPNLRDGSDAARWQRAVRVEWTSLLRTLPPVSLNMLLGSFPPSTLKVRRI